MGEQPTPVSADQLRASVVQVLEAEAFLLDIDRMVGLVERELSFRPPGEEPSAEKLKSIIEGSIQFALQQDQHALQEGLRAPEIEERYAFLSDILLLPEGYGPSVVCAFNRLQHRVRRVSLALFFRGLTVEQCIQTGLVPDEDELVRLARTGMCALLQVDEAEYLQQKKGGRA